ncbi:MAG: type II toxin-antitoxin system VapC family toxin [Leucobacter sp.]
MPAAPSALPGILGFTGLDANVLLRVMVRDDSEQYRMASELLKSLTPERPGFITQAVLVEVYWNMRRGYRVPVSDCLDAIQLLTRLPSIEFDDGEGVVRALALAREGADFPDALTHTSFEQFQCDGAVTFDRKAARRLGWRLLDAEAG